jgi:hypothetical protein
MDKDKFRVINGPTMPGVGDILYQVTLASGMIVTAPYAFGLDPEFANAPRVVVSVGGQVLAGKPITRSNKRANAKPTPKAVDQAASA